MTTPSKSTASTSKSTTTSRATPAKATAPTSVPTSTKADTSALDEPAKPKTKAKKGKKGKKGKGTARVVESLRQAFNAQYGREIVPEGGFDDRDMPNYVDPKAGK